MVEARKVTLEALNREVEKIGSLLRSMNVQIEAIRTRVTDLEQVEGNGKEKPLPLAGKMPLPGNRPRAAGKRPDNGDDIFYRAGKEPQPGEGNGNGNNDRDGQGSKRAGKDNGDKGKGKGKDQGQGQSKPKGR